MGDDDDKSKSRVTFGAHFFAYALGNARFDERLIKGLKGSGQVQKRLNEFRAGLRRPGPDTCTDLADAASQLKGRQKRQSFVVRATLLRLGFGYLSREALLEETAASIHEAQSTGAPLSCVRRMVGLGAMLAELLPRRFEHAMPVQSSERLKWACSQLPAQTRQLSEQEWPPGSFRANGLITKVGMRTRAGRALERRISSVEKRKTNISERELPIVIRAIHELDFLERRYAKAMWRKKENRYSRRQTTFTIRSIEKNSSSLSATRRHEGLRSTSQLNEALAAYDEDRPYAEPDDESLRTLSPEVSAFANLLKATAVTRCFSDDTSIMVNMDRERSRLFRICNRWNAFIATNARENEAWYQLYLTLEAQLLQARCSFLNLMRRRFRERIHRAFLKTLK